MPQSMPRSDRLSAVSLTRRRFLQSSALAAGALAGGGGLAGFEGAATSGAEVAAVGAGGAGGLGAAEALIAELYGTLTQAQRGVVAKSYDDPLRQRVEANWRITKPMAEVLDADQRDLVRQIFMALHSETYAGKVLKQVEHDNVAHDGFPGCSVAIFGRPGMGAAEPYEFVFTGRHVTRRCDGRPGDSVAFAGPIFYGHSAESFNEEPTHPGNIYWYQALRANDLYQMLDGKQREAALREDPRGERGAGTVALRGAGEIPGLSWSELSADQREHGMAILKDLLAPFRESDAAEAMRVIEAGGLENLHLSYFKNMDLGDDGVYDVWELEGPQVVWHFRGSPHVHTWVQVKA